MTTERTGPQVTLPELVVDGVHVLPVLHERLEYADYVRWAIERLAPDVAEFVRALNKARDLEGRRDKQTGSALSWYLKARSLYPNSELAQEGIDRLVEEILPASTSASRTSAGDQDRSEN